MWPFFIYMDVMYTGFAGAKTGECLGYAVRIYVPTNPKRLHPCRRYRGARTIYMDV